MVFQWLTNLPKYGMIGIILGLISFIFVLLLSVLSYGLFGYDITSPRWLTIPGLFAGIGLIVALFGFIYELLFD